MKLTSATLETQLWNARDRFIQELEVAKAKHIVTFLRSCAYEMVNEPLPPLPLPRPLIRTDPAQEQILKDLFWLIDPRVRLPSVLRDDSALAGLERMDDDEE
jgi:hypothetical protein